MAYDQNVIDAFTRASRNAPALVRKALFEAGIVESGLRNLNYGDRDSLGPLQQRPSQGWHHATDPYLAAKDFIAHAMPLYQSGRYKTAGALAADVQRPAAQYRGRYQDVRGQANSILSSLGGHNPSPTARPRPGKPGSGSGDGGPGTSPGPSLLDAGQGSDFTGLLSSLLAQKPQPQSTPLPLPSFSAGPKLPTGFQDLGPGATPQQQPRATDALGLLSALGGTAPSISSPSGTGDAQNAPGGPRAKASARGSGFHGSKVLELIHNDGGAGYGIKNGQVVNGSQVFAGVWTGHRNHVHVAAGPKTVVALGKLAQQMGLHVGENPHFGGVDPGAHVPGSYHVRGEAIDVSGPEKLMDRYARAVEKYNRTGVLR